MSIRATVAHEQQEATDDAPGGWDGVGNGVGLWLTLTQHGFNGKGVVAEVADKSNSQLADAAAADGGGLQFHAMRRDRGACSQHVLQRFRRRYEAGVRPFKASEFHFFAENALPLPTPAMRSGG